MPRKPLEERLKALEARLNARDEVFAIISPCFPRECEDLTADPNAEGWARISLHYGVHYQSGSKAAIRAHLAKLRRDPQYQKPWVSDWKPKVNPETPQGSEDSEIDRA
jgi:hypothetical protein